MSRNSLLAQGDSPVKVHFVTAAPQSASKTISHSFPKFSNRDTLPPLGFAAALPVSRQRRTQLITELGLTSKRSATSRREAPDLTSSIARSRKSPEYGLGIEFPPANQTAGGRIAHCSAIVNPFRFDHTGIRSRCGAGGPG